MYQSVIGSYEIYKAKFTLRPDTGSNRETIEIIMVETTFDLSYHLSIIVYYQKNPTTWSYFSESDLFIFPDTIPANTPKMSQMKNSLIFLFF